MNVFIYPFENVYRVTIPGTLHELGTWKLIYRAFDNSTPPQAIFGVPGYDQATHDFTLTFAMPYSGRICLYAPCPFP
jgi:hypothetical protein